MSSLIYLRSEFMMNEKIRENRKERMNLHTNKTRKYFSKRFYLQSQSLLCCSSHRSGGSQLTTECQTKKFLSHAEKLIKHLTLGHWLHYGDIAKVSWEGCNGVDILMDSMKLSNGP